MRLCSGPSRDGKSALDFCSTSTRASRPGWQDVRDSNRCQAAALGKEAVCLNCFVVVYMITSCGKLYWKTKAPAYSYPDCGAPCHCCQLLLLCSAVVCARADKQTARQPSCCCVWSRREAHSKKKLPISFDAMSFRGRPSLSGAPRRSSLEPSSDSLDLANLRADLVAARELTCFQVTAAAERERERVWLQQVSFLNTSPTVALWGWSQPDREEECVCVCATQSRIC